LRTYCRSACVGWPVRSLGERAAGGADRSPGAILESPAFYSGSESGHRQAKPTRTLLQSQQAGCISGRGYQTEMQLGITPSSRVQPWRCSLRAILDRQNRPSWRRLTLAMILRALRSSAPQLAPLRPVQEVAQALPYSGCRVVRKP